MDTVVGRRDDFKCTLTLHFPKMEFQIMIPLEELGISGFGADEVILKPILLDARQRKSTSTACSQRSGTPNHHRDVALGPPKNRCRAREHARKRASCVHFGSLRRRACAKTQQLGSRKAPVDRRQAQTVRSVLRRFVSDFNQPRFTFAMSSPIRNLLEGNRKYNASSN